MNRELLMLVDAISREKTVDRDVVFGATLPLDVTMPVTCETCAGSGAKPGAKPRTCAPCHGQGRIRAQQGFFAIERTCPTCSGRGTVIDLASYGRIACCLARPADPASLRRKISFLIAQRSREKRSSMYATCFYGILDTRTGDFHYCNAGHNAPFLVRKDDIIRLEVGGTVVGLFDFSQYDTGETPVSPGDLLVVFSDGLTEAVNAVNDEYGDDRLQACLEATRGKSAADGSA